MPTYLCTNNVTILILSCKLESSVKILNFILILIITVEQLIQTLKRWLLQNVEAIFSNLKYLIILKL